jgi:Kef-type K+ transport system membrane component KefB
MFVFYTGLHIDKDHFLGEHASRQFWIISLTSLFMPLLLGCFAGWIFIDYLYGDYLVGKGSRATYILALGISAGVTALPVLSAILLEVAPLNLREAPIAQPHTAIF